MTTLAAQLSLTFGRLQRLVQLDLTVLDEVAEDTRGTVASLLVAAVSMLLLGLGGWLWWIISGLDEVEGSQSVFFKSVLFGTIASFALWCTWLLVVYGVLQRLAGTSVRVEPLLRAAGMATLPLALGVLMFVPVISFAAGLVAVAGWVVATHIAIERATGVRGSHVFLANLAGFAVWAIVLSLLSTGDNQLAPGPFLAESLWDLVAGAS